MPRAAWTAQELLHTFAEYISSLSLIPGQGGQFEVVANGDLVFSKEVQRRFPELTELRESIGAKLD
ncbi:MAG TPA: Rdx family protein [Dehalococcoidia bacterium]|nr:Rdx family protein [Dehalococcoidia bacterium]